VSTQDEPDLDALHHAVLRERQEPYEGAERVPLWMIAGFTALVGWGGWYLGRYDARFETATPDGSLGSQAAVAVAEEPGPDGAQLYASRCAACHQPAGTGLPGLAPPLAGSEWVVGDEERMLKIVLFGLTGPVEVKGQTWDGAMPAWAATMTDDEIAAVASHVRASWGNGAAAVAPEDVAAVRGAHARSEPWTAPEL
jgi:mono/diheme cytochrome c family protein